MATDMTHWLSAFCSCSGTWVWFLEPTWQLTTLNSSFRASGALCGSCTYMVHMNSHRLTHTQKEIHLNNEPLEFGDTEMT